MGSCTAPSAKGDDKFITTDYLQQCLLIHIVCETSYIMIRFPYSVLMIVFYSINTELRFYPRCPHY
ncbi:hypothetical protein EA184_25860 [Escherichia coli]|uniref:Mobile element protein n=1 Tax=Escherichia coli TaxID=562 RepID=A0AAX0K705_ECOLX|nr:hypothetical protein CDC27_27220 [Escherichia coli]AVN57432.1 hypothetical protein [Escherichia coli]EEV5857848.1 hypothetical protein [Escherichia coli]EEW3184006.1 hypothetical protein [Escherichia coli]EFA3444183.1 hypothetical protein [Escherichia coli]